MLVRGKEMLEGDILVRSLQMLDRMGTDVGYRRTC